jgi:hypothetical protein
MDRLPASGHQGQDYFSGGQKSMTLTPLIGEIMHLCTARADTWTDSMATDECLGAQAQGRASVLIQNGDWCGILSAAHRKHRGDGKSKWVPKPEPAASGTGSYGFVDTGGEMVTLSILSEPISPRTMQNQSTLTLSIPDPIDPYRSCSCSIGS